MAYLFPSDEWVKALKDELNRSESYREAARTWEGDFYFHVEPDRGQGDQMTLYLDLWHGECRDAFAVSDLSVKSPEFEISAKMPAWKKVVKAQVDPIQALITRQLKLKGNMAKVLRSVKAAQELVQACTRVPTEFPE